MLICSIWQSLSGHNMHKWTFQQYDKPLMDIFFWKLFQKSCKQFTILPKIDSIELTGHGKLQDSFFLWDTIIIGKGSYLFMEDPVNIFGGEFCKNNGSPFK